MGNFNSRNRMNSESQVGVSSVCGREVECKDILDGTSKVRLKVKTWFKRLR